MILDYLSLMRFEVLALGAVILLLLIKVFSEKMNISAILGFVNFSLLVILGASFIGRPHGSMFGGMFLNDGTLMLEKSIITFATLLISLQANNWLKNHSSYLEFYLLLFSVLIGMYFMISSGNFLMFYLGLEMATIPLAALAAFDFNRIRSAEGAGKMILSSAFSSAILLFGLSLLYGTTGSLDFGTVSRNFTSGSLSLLGLSFLLVGFAFKISAVPFHFWTADTYEGSPVAIATFLSVVSKGAAFFIFITILYKVFGAVYEKWIHALTLLSAITMTIGNLFAMRQLNIKRFLAFSSITQAGYILIAVASGTKEGMASIIYFLLIYIFSNVGAFTVVSIICDKTGKDDIDDYKGLYKTNPKLSIAMMIALLSLAGVPPTAGFFGKLFLLTSGASKGLIVLLVIASLNMVISLYYYLKVVKVMFVDKNENPIENISSHISAKIVLIICLIGILSIGFINCIFEYIHALSFGI
ncbi:MAG: NADH-quinone oxidoreductase subunit N [Bacteroidetes bacterium]|nr:MAG: NADH-quinone oxidoreductase subunit N [Bacteroidota bacterium]